MHQKIWRRDQFGRVKTASRVVTQEERQRRLSNSAKSQERLEWECEQRKKLLRDIDKRRQGSAKSANSSVRHGGVAAALSETALNENVRKESRSAVFLKLVLHTLMIDLSPSSVTISLDHSLKKRQKASVIAHPVAVVEKNASKTYWFPRTIHVYTLAFGAKMK